MTIQALSLETRARKLVGREVLTCVSALVHTLAQGSGHVDTDTRRHADRIALASLTDQAAELFSPILDYEAAAEEAGWRHEGDVWSRDDFEDAETSAENACFASDVEPHEREVFEHWAVTEWLAIKLEERGEKVDRDFADMAVWARTTSGQLIAADAVIERIVSETGFMAGEPA